MDDNSLCHSAWAMALEDSREGFYRNGQQQDPSGKIMEGRILTKYPDDSAALSLAQGPVDILLCGS